MQEVGLEVGGAAEMGDFADDHLEEDICKNFLLTMAIRYNDFYTKYKVEIVKTVTLRRRTLLCLLYSGL